MNNGSNLPSLARRFAAALAAAAGVALAGAASGGVLVEAEGFAQKGGWVVDQQFMDQMGSPFLMAHGLGVPVADAVTAADFSKAGKYRLWVRTRDWCRPDSKVDGPGAFRVSVGGADAGRFGVGGSGSWEWWKGPEVSVKAGANEIRLRDETGFDGRVDALFFGAEGETPPETWAQRKRLLGLPERTPDAGDFEFVVVGGGYAGMCAAVAAARLGVKTAILQDRPVFGGNGSGEVRVGPIGGLDLPPFPRNSDLMHEINALSRGEGHTSGGVRPKPDDNAVDRWMRGEANLACFTSTRGVSVEMNPDGMIAAVVGRDVETSRELRFPAKLFCDATGDAWLGVAAGAEVRTKPERKEDTMETLAAAEGETPGGYGSSNFWITDWTDEERPFPRCPWAHDVTAESVDVTRPRWPVTTDRPYVAGWNWECGFDRDAVDDGEWIRDNNFRAAYGTWDYYKNKATNRAAYAKAEMTWMGYVTGKRAARRIVGDYVLCEQDLTQRRVYADGVVPTTWYLDMHFAHPRNERHFPGHAYRSCAYDDPNWESFGVKNGGRMTTIRPYPIPFRCLYSKTVPNLFMAGKDISVTHVAMASVRVENTTGQMGTVVGRAVPLCLRNGWTPRELATEHFDALAAQLRDPRPEVWLFLAGPDKPDAPLVAATVAWMAEKCGALCDSYFECYRDGRLFAESGSQVVSGRHFQDFNYLCARANVKVVTYGRTTLFDSSVSALGLERLGGGSAEGVYGGILSKRPALAKEVKGYLRAEGFTAELAPYLYPEVAYAQRVYLPDGVKGVERLESGFGVRPETKVVRAEAGETVATLSKRMAETWKGVAKGVFFGDPAALACRVPAEVRRRSVPVFAPCAWKGRGEIAFSGYTESESPLAPYAAQLACALGNRVIEGRQTADGDIFLWSRSGCSVQVVDPYRPTFPCVSRLPQFWAEDARPADDDPSDEQLREWARKGMVLTTLLWHSGEVAHNEAMLNVIEYAQVHRFKMGVAVHAQRYETCPQLWELLRVPVDRGGAAELIEPVLHSAGLGVAVESNYPPELLTRDLREARERIARVAGSRNVPVGYYAFMDSDLETCTTERPDVWKAVADAGLDYFVSSARPGNPRVLSQDGITVINQTFRTVEGSSPFVRVTEAVDLQRGPGTPGPGWRIGVLDSPVVAFSPYIWERGRKFIELAEQLKTGACSGWFVNVKPRVIARYARIIAEMGLIKATSPKTAP